MALFCLIHGSTQSSEGWNLLIPELENRGHEVVTVDLPADEPHASATRYADVIVRALDQTDRDEHDVVMVAHSASGMFLPLAASRRTIKRMVFLAAVVPKPGTSIIDQFRDDPGMFNPEWVGKNPLADEVAREFLFHDCTSEVMEWALGTRILMNAQRALTEVCPMEHWPDVPASYIVCAEDRTISPQWSRRVGRERLGVSPIELPGGHCPHVSRPSMLAESLVAESRTR